MSTPGAVSTPDLESKLAWSENYFSRHQVLALYALVAFITVIPIWAHPLPPISDYVNHLSRMYVIAQGAGNATTNAYYQIDWQIVPNLAMDLIVPLLARGMSVYAAGQLFLVMTFVLVSTGTMAVHRALFGRGSLLPLLSLPLMYNHVLLVGTVKYIFGIGVALWAFAGWIAIKDRSFWVRAAAGAALSVPLFFSHLFVVGVFGLAALAFELS